MPRNIQQRWRTSTAKVTRAQQLRREQTPAEALLWQHLRAHRMLDLHFRRQHPIDRFIVDFCCLPRRLVIEIDGSIHEQQQAYDAERTVALEALGYRVLRWTNDQIENDLESVLAAIRHHLLQTSEGEVYEPRTIVS